MNLQLFTNTITPVWEFQILFYSKLLNYPTAFQNYSFVLYMKQKTRKAFVSYSEFYEHIILSSVKADLSIDSF